MSVWLMLQVSLVINCGCIIVAVLAACLISVDLAHWTQERHQEWKVKPNETLQSLFSKHI